MTALQSAEAGVEPVSADDTALPIFKEIAAGLQYPRIADIQEAVCREYKLKQRDMLSPERAQWAARPRQLAMYLSRRLTARSLAEIGRLFGGRDHTTVLHADRTITALISTDPDTALVALRVMDAIETVVARRIADLTAAD